MSDKPFKPFRKVVDEVKFTVPGPPKGKQRPRVVSRGGFVRAYTPKETIDYENLVRKCYKEQIGDKKLEGPISATILMYLPIPKSASKKKQMKMLQGDIMPAKRIVDIDNGCKSCMDACNGLAFDDDSQVVTLISSKYYSDNPRAEIFLRSLEDEEKT